MILNLTTDHWQLTLPLTTPMFDRRLVQNFDWVLLGLVVIICATGIVNLYSAGYNRGEGTPSTSSSSTGWRWAWA